MPRFIRCIGGQYDTTRQEWDGESRSIIIRAPLPPMSTSMAMSEISDDIPATTRVPPPAIYRVASIRSDGENIYFACPLEWSDAQALKFLFGG